MIEAIDIQEVFSLVSDTAVQTIPYAVTYPSTRVEILVQTQQESGPIAGVRNIAAQDGVLGFWKGCLEKLWLDYSHHYVYRLSMFILDKFEPTNKNFMELSQQYAQKAYDEVFKQKNVSRITNLARNFIAEVSDSDPYRDVRLGLRLGLSGMYVLYSMGALTLAESDELTTLAASNIKASDALVETIRKESTEWPGWRDVVGYGCVYGSLLGMYFGLRLSIFRGASELQVAGLHVLMSTLSYPLSTIRRQMTMQRLGRGPV